MRSAAFRPANPPSNPLRELAILRPPFAPKRSDRRRGAVEHVVGDQSTRIDARPPCAPRVPRPSARGPDSCRAVWLTTPLPASGWLNPTTRERPCKPTSAASAFAKTGGVRCPERKVLAVEGSARSTAFWAGAGLWPANRATKRPAYGAGRAGGAAPQTVITQPQSHARASPGRANPGPAGLGRTRLHPGSPRRTGGSMAGFSARTGRSSRRGWPLRLRGG